MIEVDFFNAKLLLGEPVGLFLAHQAKVFRHAFLGSQSRSFALHAGRNRPFHRLALRRILLGSFLGAQIPCSAFW